MDGICNILKSGPFTELDKGEDQGSEVQPLVDHGGTYVKKNSSKII